MRRISDLDAFARTADSAAYDPSARPNRSVAETLNEIRFHAEFRYWQYMPCYGENFEDRLISWLNNSGLARNDQEALLRLLPELGFIDRDDMTTLYRTAYTGQIQRWMMDQEGLDFNDSEGILDRKIGHAIRKTWICPLTDSLDISQFYHVNRIDSHSHRPLWQTLAKFGTPERIEPYLKKHDIERLVIVEDIVGSGTQACPILNRVVTDLMPGTPLLFVPLIISESGLRQMRATFATSTTVTIDPALTVPAIVHVGRSANPGEPSFVGLARSVAETTKKQFRRRAFGYRDVGSLIVLYTNCPNNTPAFLWSSKKNWTPLFPRVSRPND